MTGPSRNIDVFYSNRTEQLVDALAMNLDRSDAFQSVFENPTVLVPNWNLSRYLKYELSQRFGVSRDYFSSVEDFLQAAPGEDVQFLDDTQLRAAILRVLSDEDFLDSEASSQVKRYLFGDGSGGDEPPSAAGSSVTLKRYQLAKRLTKNFRQYGHSRVEMIEQWFQEPELFLKEDYYRTNERWQKRLWKELFDRDGRFNVNRTDEGPDRYLLTEYFRRVDSSDLDLPPVIDVFGISHFAPVYGRIFEVLAERTQLRFYVLNPCREFWEDVIYDEEDEVHKGESLLTDRRGKAEDEVTEDHHWELDPESSDEPPLALTAWGRAGRDLINMLNTLSGYSFREHWEDPLEKTADPTLLEQFQSDVLNYRKPEPDPPAWEDDRSIQFLSCPSKRREVEVVADEIWSLVVGDEPGESKLPGEISFDDIAVILNPRDREEYQAQIESVFEQVHEIPFNQIDLTRGEGSRLLEGIEDLLRLPAEPIERENLLTVLTHPNFMADEFDPDPEQFKQWVDDLAIFNGADQGDHDGTYIDRDLFNWNQGMKRLVLGNFMEETDREGTSRWFETGEDAYRPRSVSESDAALASALVASVRSLISGARSIRNQKRSLNDWFDWMADYVRNHFSPADEASEPEYHSYLGTLSALADIDAGPEAVNYETALEFAMDELQSSEYEIGNYLSSGVVVSSFTPQRPIPFDVIFMLGMNEEDFPDSSPRSPLDLDTEQWQEGDLRDRDREQYMFLDTLLCARDRVYLSWVSQDPVTGDDVEPSSVLRELQSILEGYCGEEGLEDRVIKHPLRRHDNRYFESDSAGSPATQNEEDTGDLKPTFNPEAIGEARVKRLRRRVLDSLGDPDNSELSFENLSSEARDLMLSVEPPGDADDSGEAPSRPIELRSKALEKFLVSPLQGWARYKLGLVDEDEDTIVDQNDEPFETEQPWATILRRGAIEDATLRAGTVPDLSTVREEYDVEKRTLQAQGTVPAGIFGDLQRTKDHDLLEEWRAALGEQAPQSITRYRFGSAGRSENAELVRPIEFTIQRRDETESSVDLVGDTQLVDTGTNTIYYFGESSGPTKFLRCFLSGMMLTARGVLPDGDFRTVLLLDDDFEERTFTVGDRDSARRYLKTWVTELLTQPHNYRLPMDVTKDFLDAGGAGSGRSYEERVREKDESSWSSTRDEYGPVENIGEYTSPGYETDDPDLTVEDRIKRLQQAFWEGFFSEPWNEIVGGEVS
ncbi:MAG: exodeoxyribonuclease V subunit gamma [bacterium]